MALIGSANSGKSLLLNTLTGSKAEVADYPYTTQVPVLGVLKTDPPLTLCEIPSLRDSNGDLRYLNQITRAKLIILVVDLSSSRIEDEIEVFKLDSITNKQLLVVGTKKDLLSKPMRRTSHKKKIPFLQVSALQGEGLQELEEIIMKLTLEQLPLRNYITEERVRFSIDSPKVIHLGEGVFEIKSYEIESALSSINTDTPRGMQIFRKKVRELGLEKLLIEAGIKPYEQVKIGRSYFTYIPEE